MLSHDLGHSLVTNQISFDQRDSNFWSRMCDGPLLTGTGSPFLSGFQTGNLLIPSVLTTVIMKISKAFYQLLFSTIQKLIKGLNFSSFNFE